jgi:branched-chain amino acid aminotransferase
MTADFINYNGNLLPSGQPLLTANNRGFRYGDGLFETMLVKPGGVRLKHFHFERLISGMRLLRFEVPPLFTPDHLERQILELCAINGEAGSGGLGGAGSLWGPGGLGSDLAAASSDSVRARLVVFRGDGNLSGPVDPIPHYIIQTGPIPATSKGWNKAGLAIDVFPDGRKSADGLSALKSNNYLLYAMASMYARAHGLDDCLVLNSQGRFADSTIANLFYTKGDTIYTPPLSEGGVAGVMRRYLLESLLRAGYTVREQPTGPADLAQAGEIFLTNALKGINWVRSFRGSTYTHRLAADLYQRFIVNL